MPEPSEALCLSCGLCCDGTLFTAIPLLPDDAVPLPVQTSDTGARTLPQPCAGLDGCTCTVYAQRPRACRQYRCLLLVALEADEVSLDDAKQTVAGLRERLAALGTLVDRELPASKEAPIQRARRAAQEGGVSEELKVALASTEEALRFHVLGHARR